MIVGSILGSSGQSQTTQSDPATLAGSDPQQDIGTETKPVEPASQNTSADNSGADGGGAAEKTSSQQAQAAARQQPASDAEPQSVVNAIAADGANDVSRARAGAAFSLEQARTQALLDSVAVVQGQSPLFEQPEKLDRYAPPDLLSPSEASGKAPSEPARPTGSSTGN